jgi:hypothetical protein
MAGRCESRGGGRYGWSAMAPRCGRGLSTGPRSLPAPTATPRTWGLSTTTGGNLCPFCAPCTGGSNGLKCST